MKDKLLEMAFTDRERWEAAVNKGLGKGINKKILRDLCDEKVRVEMYEAIRDGRYEIAPPHTAQIPKDEPGQFRTVYVNEPMDRVLLSLINDLLFDTCKDMVHPACMSYQRGLSCGTAVEQLSQNVERWQTDAIVGFKADLSKYFDSVPIEFIDWAFNEAEVRNGHSALIDVLRKYYHSDLYFDENSVLCHKYQSLKQGCAVAAWLADVVLYDVDKQLDVLQGIYKRYSDDIVFIGPDHERALDILRAELINRRMALNPKKLEMIDRNHWFKFLGFSIKGKDISLSSNGIKKFQKAIEEATIDRRNASYQSALHAVYRALYKGYDGHSWATRVLRVVNVPHDLIVLNGFVMDCLRAVQTGKRKVGGLGYVREQKNGCIARGTGRNVKANKEKIPTLDGYLTITCMANNLRTSRDMFETIIRLEM